MEPLLVYPDPPPSDLAHALDRGGWAWVPVSGVDRATKLEPEEGWTGAVVWAAETAGGPRWPARTTAIPDLSPSGAAIEPEGHHRVGDADGAFTLCRALRRRDLPVSPLLIMVEADQLADLELREELFDDLCVVPFHPAELEARLKHLFWRSGRGTRPELVEYGPLVLNLETYQAAVGGHPLDLTYMEYELLRFLATHPGRVFTRETLLSRVWGYEYFGGARTVDVHIRRLRAKLGDQHAPLIHTVRSVGYRLGQPRWP
ncbi:MAG TPA: response regulator transcription factor [Acidimicrobiales bacterium]|nr:response regulator transcription factor [Acidimicrobiales bacterium]